MKTIKKLLISFLALCSLSIMVTAQTLHYNRPAEYFEEALVIGNGTLGGIVYGGTAVDKISLNDITLWTGEPCNMNIYSPDAHKTIPLIREALSKGEYQKADSLQRDVQGHFSQNYQPLGQLQIEYLDVDGQISNYRRWLDIGNATAHTVYHRGKYQYSLEYFVTNPDSGLVIRLTTDNPAGIKTKLSLSCQLRNNIYASDGMIINDGYAGYGSLPSYYDADEKFAYDENRGVHFRTIVKADASRVRENGASLIVEGGKDVTLYIVNATSFNGYDKDPVKQGRDYKAIANNALNNITSKSYNELISRHITDYKNIYDRVSLSLGGSDKMMNEKPTDVQLREYLDEKVFNPELEELYFQYGRYLLISCSRTPNVPANLQGLWNESILPPWSCNYTSNINLEENYWAAETGAMPEMHQSLLSFMKELQGSGELTAKAYYGVNKGWCLAHNTDIWAMTCPVGLRSGDPNWANWNMGGAWVSTHIWEHYSFSLDKAFLQEYYPVLKGAAEFCMNWLVESRDMMSDGKSYLITAPSTSPENIYVNPQGYHGRTCYGGFADIAMIRECLADAKSAAIELVVDKQFVNQVDETLLRLQPYKIGKKGNLQEWFYDWEDEDPHHRHQSHLFGVYPGHHVEDGVNTRQEIYNAASRSLELKGDRTTGWSTGWRVNLYARLHDAENAYHIYRKLLSYVSPDNYKGPDARRGGGTYPNLLDAHSPFQIDGNFGGCAGVLEMLVQSEMNVDAGKHEVVIELLPALPANWKDGEVHGVRARGGLSVDITWSDSKVGKLVITAQKACRITLICNGMSKSVKLKKGVNAVTL
ncbi:MAG: glycoside hydrolase family 95 protein [Bacteroidaceae bacterium]|nr:glycoside hydrolase family 95 protein [Bacteroidaceae bacterium]